MKTKLFLFILLFPILLYGQEFTKFRINNKQKNAFLKEGNTDFLMLELYLDENEEILENTKYPSSIKLADVTSLLSSIKQKSETNKKLLQDVCLNCYIEEYNSQLKHLESLIIIEKERDKEAIQKRDSILNERKIKQDSIYNSNFKTVMEKPYDRFIFAMDMLGEKNNVKYGQFTIFTNMDIELSRTRFSMYLQDNGFTYGDEKKQINKPNLIQEYYVRKSASNDEINDFIQINYNYTVRNDLPSYSTTILNGEYPCWLIDRVKIEGTANTIISLYLFYWAQSKKSLGGNTIGEIAHHVFMGDKITLIRINQNRYRIEITKQSGIGMDYYESYKIIE